MDRSPRLGYALAAAAAGMWAANGSLARFLLDDGVSPSHLSQLRSVASFAILVVAVAIWRRADLRIAREDVPRLAFLGVAGLALVHATYFFAITRLEIGVALTIQYLGPLILLLWLRLVHKRALPRTLWAAVALSVVGSFLVVEAYDADALSGLGMLAAFASAIAFATYLWASEQAGHRYPAHTTLIYGFGFAGLFWLVVRPPWTFPAEAFAGEPVNVVLALGVAVVGTLVPFLCIVGALRHIPAPRAALVATLEPVLAALVAWPVHGETLAAPQIAGGLIVIASVLWVQAQRSSHEVEAAPTYGGLTSSSGAR